MAKKKGRPSKRRTTERVSRSKKTTTKTGAKKPFAKKPKKIPKRKKAVKAKASRGTIQKNNLTRQIWKEVWGSNKSWKQKDWAQKTLHAIFVWFPLLLISGTIFWVVKWWEIRWMLLKIILLPILIIVWFTLGLFLFVGYIQILVFLTIPILVLLNFIILWWVHRIANHNRKKFNSNQRRSSRYSKVYPERARAEQMPRVTPRRR